MVWEIVVTGGGVGSVRRRIEDGFLVTHPFNFRSPRIASADEVIAEGERVLR
jgi:hypothetical protein